MAPSIWAAPVIMLKLPSCHKKVEPMNGFEPLNLFLTKEALYLLSYMGLDFKQLNNYLLIA